jgi:putative hydrolase of HD superfamily
MQHITTKLLDPNKPASKRIQALYHEYEKRESREAKFVKDLDLLEMALQASEYEEGMSILIGFATRA